MRHQPSTAPGGGLSWFLIFYLLMLLSVLLSVHELQPEREGPASSSRSPVHQERQKAAKQTAAWVHRCVLQRDVGCDAWYGDEAGRNASSP